MRTDLLKVDFSNYESPIQKFVMDVQKKMMQEEENQLFMSVKQTIGFSVDKEELLKALKYDRDQYEKGYIDGLKANDWIPTKEQQYWENAQEALSRIFDQCEEIDPQSGYNMLEDIQFVRGFINKHKPQESEDKEVEI